MPKASDEDELIVRVYFGSWSPICERIVPKIMAVEEAWRFVRFEYYGLPKPLSDDELARSQGITGLQTVLVLRGGEEVAVSPAVSSTARKRPSAGAFADL
jgi:thiol-disulfide isomerase/thioredoxin